MRERAPVGRWRDRVTSAVASALRRRAGGKQARRSSEGGAEAAAEDGWIKYVAAAVWSSDSAVRE